VFSTLLLCGSVLVTSAQSLVFSVPSTDIQSEKSLYVEGDFIAHLDRYQNGGFQLYGPRFVYGLRNDLEIGANIYYTRYGDESTAELQPNIKWKAYEKQKQGIAVSVGSLVFVPLNSAAGTRTSAMFYANVSKTVESAKGMRLTGGIYTMAGTEQGFGTKTGAILGFEQPVTKKLTFMVDWTSGKNRFGYSNVALGYAPNKSQYFGVGYSFGNAGRGNNSFTAFYGFTF
jgi:hypothetical protein